MNNYHKLIQEKQINLIPNQMSFQKIRRMREIKKQNSSELEKEEQYPMTTQKKQKVDFQFLLSQAQGLTTARHFMKKTKKQPSSHKQQMRNTFFGSNSKEKRRLTPIISDFLHVNLEEFNKFPNRRFSDAPKPKRTQTGLTRIGQKESVEKVKKISPKDFVFEYVIGKGAFGKVWKVHDKRNRIYAIKQMKKVKIVSKKSVQSVMNEKKLLCLLKNPFLVNMHYSFQNEENLFLVMDYCSRGDLRYHLKMKEKFKENQAKFFIACIILCLEYLHSKGIIHKDLKPQNLVLDSRGYVRVTDLGVSRLAKSNNAEDMSGTPSYMAPQVMCKLNHSFPVDFYALGVIAYEFMTGSRPYSGKQRKQIKEQMVKKQAKIENIESGWSKESILFINSLLQRNPENRLGYQGINELKHHSWFKGFEWEKLTKNQIVPPFIPRSTEQNYANYKECISSDTEIDNQQQYKKLVKRIDVQKPFYGYEGQQRKNSQVQVKQKYEKKDFQQFFHIQTRSKFYN